MKERDRQTEKKMSVGERKKEKEEKYFFTYKEERKYFLNYARSYDADVFCRCH